MAYLEEDVDGGRGRAKKAKAAERWMRKKEEKREARQRSCRDVVRLQSERGFLCIGKVTYRL